jgi:ATP-dependent Clp protease protease subunit
MPPWLSNQQASPEQVEMARVSLENQISDLRLKKKLQGLIDEKEDLRCRYDLLLQRQKNQLAELEAAWNKAALENRLEEERRKGGEAEFQRLSQENRIAAERNRAELLELAKGLEKLKLENDWKAERQRSKSIEDDGRKREMEMESKRMDVEERRLQVERSVLDARMARLKSDLEMRERKDEWKKASNTEPVYLASPFDKGRLVVSDRRIALNGPIAGGAGDFVAERIQYFNNVSTQPVFVVIDHSPGGSAMEGYRILKAMESSKAPVIVVVKSMAASMAAVIAALAPQSFAYPSAVILHHQLGGIGWGNMTQLKEQLELGREWERRLQAPVARKMGLSLEEFRKKMYEKNSDGDWQEFGDNAVACKWVGGVVDQIDETGITKNPDSRPSGQGNPFPLNERIDEKGRRFVLLPRLEPFDFYFIYNPDGYYR